MSGAAGTLDFQPAFVQQSDAVLSLLLFFAMVAWPLYVLPPGYPQPVTIVLFCACVWLFFTRPEGLLRCLLGQEVLLVTIFVAYTTIVNLFFATLHQNLEPIRYSIFYVQVWVACIVVYHYVRSNRLAIKALYYGVLTSLILQFALVFMFVGSDVVRQTGTFNNPNQLGFYAVLALGFVVVLKPRMRGSNLVFAVGVMAAVLLALLSLSKAAVVAMLSLLMLSAAVARPRRQFWARIRPLLMLAVPVLAVSAVIVFREDIELIQNVVDRLAIIGLDSDDSLGQRGYGRITEWPQYLVFGAGEGLLYRWDLQREIHSMFGTLVFSYGLPGTIVFLSLLAVAWRRNARDCLVVVPPILLYSLTHHPLRQPMMWVLLVLICQLSARSSGVQSAPERRVDVSL